MSDSEEETKWSPAGFEAPEPEVDDEMVVCAGCGEAAPASEMGVTADEKSANGDGEVLQVTRVYIHDDEDCMFQMLGVETPDPSDTETAQGGDQTDV